ncbi:hypothetical protein CXB51_027781 [Gossypium anomalum]|uniref:Uncharacterized protein n=1 Tax=Gossypium anomalum TaxID=47600 RepID=A0A8J6CJZ6_9ROSI|nr:hypothetical protein CXB51_027781 [Gossypium anomalum]
MITSNLHPTVGSRIKTSLVKERTTRRDARRAVLGNLHGCSG